MQAFLRNLVGLGAVGAAALLAACGTAPHEETSANTTISSPDEDSGSSDGSNLEPPACTVLEDGTCSGGKERCCQVEASRFDFEAQCWRPAGPSSNVVPGYGTLACIPSSNDAPGCRTVFTTVCKTRMLPDGELDVIRTPIYMWKGDDEWLACEATEFADFDLTALPDDVCP